MAATDLPSGTVYPQLGRLERQGLVKADWEPDDVARREARPRRRYYVITKAGADALQRALEDLRSLAGADRVPSTVKVLGNT
jgi:PadR family transcriptional regulator, regulatory protein PadR